jgi:hypothetical protein
MINHSPRMVMCAVLKKWEATFRTTLPPPASESSFIVTEESSSGIISEPSSEEGKREGRGKEMGLLVFEWMAEGSTVVPNTFAFNLLLETCANTNHTEVTDPGSARAAMTSMWSQSTGLGMATPSRGG